MAFRKFGGLNYSASNNIVRNNLANSDNLTISKKLGLLNSKIPVESHLDMSGNSIMNVGSIFFFADGSVQTTAYDTTGGAPGNFTTGTFSGLLSANGGFQCTDASFSGPVNVNDGIQGTDATFSGLIRANGGISGTNANFSGLLSANGGISGTNANFSGLLSANGGISGNNANFSGLISANGGISGTTGYFNNLVVAGGTAYFANIPLCLDTAVSSYTPGSLGQLTTKAYVDSKITSVSSIQVSNSTAGIYYPVLTSAIGAGQTMYASTSQLFMNTNTNLLNVSGVTATTGYFSGLLSGNGGVTASTGFFKNMLSADGGVTATTGFFKNMLSAEGGFTGSTGFFKNMLSANGGFTGSTGFFGGLLTANGGFTGSTGFFGGLLSANGGFTGSTGFFGGLLSANGGFTGSTGFFGGLLSANGGFTGSTGFFKNLLSADGGFTGSTGFFGGLLSANGGFTGSTGFFGGLLSSNGGFTGSTGFFKNMLSADGGFTGSTGFFKNMLSADGGFTGSTGFFKNMLSADGGFTGSTGFFKNMLSADGGFTGSTGFFKNMLSADGGVTASTGFFKNMLSADGGVTASTGFFKNMLSADGGVTASTGFFKNMLSADGGFTASNAFITGGVTGLSTAYFGGLLSANGGITATTGNFSNVSTNSVSLRDTTNTYSNATIGQTGDALMLSMAVIGNTAGSLYINPVGRGYIPKADINGTKITWNITQGGETDFINLAIGQGATSTTGFNFYAGADGNTASLIGQIRPYIPPGDVTLNLATTAWVTNALSTGSSTTASKINILASALTSTTCYIPFTQSGLTGPSNLYIDEATTAPSLTYQPSTNTLNVNTLNVPGNIVCGATGKFQTLKIEGFGGITGPAFSVSHNNNSSSYGLVQPAGNQNDRGLQYYWGNTGASDTPLVNMGVSQFLNLAQSGSGGFAFYNTRSSGYPGVTDYTKTLLQIDANANSYFYGNINATGEVTAAAFNATSDYRIKENPVPIADTVDALRPLHYFNKLTNKEDFGFLAHEVQELFPFLVQGDKDGDGNQSLNYMGLIALLVKEVQELKQKINNIL